MQRRLWAGIVAGLCTLGLAAVRVGAQDDAFRLLSGALVGPKYAYVPLPAEYVCGRMAQITPSPTGQDALIIHSALPPARSVGALTNTDKRAEDAMGGGRNLATNLVLWSGDNTASVVWRGGASLANGYNSPMSVDWLPDTRIALVTVMVMPGPITKERLASDDTEYTLTFLRVNGATGKTQLLLTGVEKEARLIVSPTAPVAVLLSADRRSLRRITPTGVTPPVALSGILSSDDSVFWMGWLGDGKTLRGSVLRTGADGKRKRAVVLLDTLTGEVSENTGTQAPTIAQEAVAASPFTVQQGRETLTQDGAKTTVYPLWVQGREADTTGRTLIAADSDPQTPPVVLQTAVLFQNKGAVYAVPLLKSNAADFLTARQAAQKAETMRRAKQIGVASMMYAQDYDENFPPVGSDFGKITDPYHKNPDVFNNPATGQAGFTPAYKMTAIRDFENPAATPLGYLTGPGGRAIVFADGHVKWEDIPDKP